MQSRFKFKKGINVHPFIKFKLFAIIIRPFCNWIKIIKLCFIRLHNCKWIFLSWNYSNYNHLLNINVKYHYICAFVFRFKSSENKLKSIFQCMKRRICVLQTSLFAQKKKMLKIVFHPPFFDGFSVKNVLVCLRFIFLSSNWNVYVSAIFVDIIRIYTFLLSICQY